MKSRIRIIAGVITIGFAAIPAVADQGKRTPPGKKVTAAGENRPIGVMPADAGPTAKVIQYRERDVPQIHTKLRYTTLIVLPKDEVILDFVCGDKDLWVINGDLNFAYVKPAKENAQTNLNLVTASGNVYSFTLMEVTGTAGVQPDLKVFIQLTDAPTMQPAPALRRFVSVQELEEYRAQLQACRDEARQTKEQSQAAIDAGIKQFVTNVRFAYRFEANKQPFYIRSMYHDDQFTYIQARPEETPTLYEIKDGSPSLVSFDYKDGVYVASKILDTGYFAVGKKRLKFTRVE